MADVTYRVCFTAADGRRFHWRTYRTFGGAYRFVQRKWETFHFRQAHGIDHWWIERETGDTENGIYRVSGVILAMSRGCQVQNRYLRVG